MSYLLVRGQVKTNMYTKGNSKHNKTKMRTKRWIRISEAQTVSLQRMLKVALLLWEDDDTCEKHNNCKCCHEACIHVLPNNASWNNGIYTVFRMYRWHCKQFPWWLQYQLCLDLLTYSLSTYIWANLESIGISI